jgi:haloalkane dehalogenase
MVDRAAAEAVIERHRAAGRTFVAAGIGSFVRAAGSGEPVVCMHGLPASSFLYRKLIDTIAGRGLEGLSFDLPGLGLAERPVDADYSLVGLGGWSVAAVDAIGLDTFHLVVHDAGGPVGLEMAARQPERIRSLTILNTVIRVGSTPFVGEVLARFARRLTDRTVPPRLFRELMYRVGVQDRTALTPEEAEAYRLLALGSDGGAAYLQIMQGLRTGHPGDRWARAVDSRRVPYPVRLVWGGLDPALPLRRYGYDLLAATGLPGMTVLPAKHFLQEDQAPAIADIVLENVASAR